VQRKNTITKDIDQYYNQSWQIEMLIAGGLLFSLYNFGDTLRLFFLSVESNVNQSSNQMILFFGAYIFTAVLLIGFAANLILRAVWLAYLGISFAFRDGIDYTKLRGSLSYKEQLKMQPTAVERVSRLEVWCKLSFSFAVLISLFVLSILITVSFAVWVLNTIAPGAADGPVITYVILLAMTLIQLGLVDRLLATKKEVGFWPSVRRGASSVFNILTLSFLYRRESLVLKTNVNKWLIYGFAILYIAIAVIISVNRIGKFYTYGTFNVNLFDEREMYELPFNKTLVSSEYEANLTSNDRIAYLTIQSEIIKDDYLKVFVLSNQVFDYVIERSLNKVDYEFIRPDSINTSKKYQAFSDANDAKFSNAIDAIFRTRIDDGEAIANEWFSYTHPLTKQEGYVTYIPIKDLSSAKHTLYVDRVYFDKDDLKYSLWVNVKFWKE